MNVCVARTEKKKYIVSGFVEVVYFTEILATSESDAIKRVQEREKEGLNIWNGGTWESPVQNLVAEEDSK